MQYLNNDVGLGRSRIKNVIFDLDGTLIDSADSILTGLKATTKKFGFEPALPLNVKLVGPPLKQTIQKLVGDQANIDLNILVDDFKNYYDTEGFKASAAYPGMEKLLGELYQLGIRMYLATNKRLEPTLNIINYFNWASLFEEIYAIDRFVDAPFSDKAEMIGCLIQKESIDKKSTIYVGDRFEDYEAAVVNSINYILVDWGYGDLSSNHLIDIRKVETPDELLGILKKNI
jgi:phosphoglycolate phosphatase